MKSAHKSLVLLLSLTTMISACDVKHNLDEMHDSTVEMNKTTKDMSDTTSQMNKRTEGLENGTNELYNSLRQGDSKKSRRDDLAALVAAKDPAFKLAIAATYFMAFEYQFWNDQGQDAGKDKRIFLASKAAQQFFQEIYQFVPKGKMKPSPMAGQIISTEKSNLVNCFNAISATLHILNPKQELFLKSHPEIESLSMYKIIQESLQADVEIEAGRKTVADYPEYVNEVLANKDVAIYLMQARYNYLLTLFLARSANISTDKIAAGLMLVKDWDLDLTKFDAAQLEQFAEFLGGALKTKKILQSVHLPVPTDAMVARMFNHMNVLKASPQILTAEKSAASKEILENITELKKF